MTPSIFHNGRQRWIRKSSLFTVILLSLFALTSILNTSTALPYPAPAPELKPVQLAKRHIPIVSALLGGRTRHNNGNGNGVDLKASIISIRRPHFPRSNNQDQAKSTLRKRLDEDGAASEEQLHYVPSPVGLVNHPDGFNSPVSIRTDEDPLLEKRGKADASGYKPGGPGSGGQYDKGQPFGR
ncbi:hypothetical protein BGZ50_000860 [Haplosporangium sp. Z 11]|nr:hypothetical protein BGZ50_000860 [Haplosporangium sp. Z 11]